MVNLNISWWRRRWRDETPSDSLPEPPPGQDLTDQADVRDTVRQALATLPCRQRAVIVLRYFDDLTEAQTAAAMGCSVGTVKSQASRALSRLRGSPLLTGLDHTSIMNEAADDRPRMGGVA